MKKIIRIEGLRTIRSGKMEALIVKEVSHREGMFEWTEWPVVDKEDLKDLEKQYDIGPADVYSSGNSVEKDDEVFLIRPGIYYKAKRIGA